MSTPEIDPDDRRKHLDYLQAAITRMAAASATTKGWLLPVVTATYGYALTKRADSIALLGVGAVVLFAVIDTNYLDQERAFRRLYNAVVRGTPAIPVFEMDPTLAAPPAPPVGAGRWRRVPTRLRQWLPAWRIWTSWAIAPLYGALLVMGLAIFVGVH
ncbi:hypothetical protein ACFYTQ_06530 [Nocardia sp. NPDC004068]|uniref:hypothetical protein n=1 Tax=Nocardia sp. NPDC004068 TaxID=3364303 RepID=UPI0036B44D29